MSDLQKISAARAVLEQAQADGDVAAAAKVVGYAESMAVALKKAGQAEEQRTEAMRLALEAARATGAMLASSGIKAGRPAEANTAGLAVLGVTQRQSSDWQAIARLEQDIFDKHLRLEEPTKARLLRKARDEDARQRKHDTPIPDEVIVDLRLGDFRDVLADLTDVDAVITDPPYPAEYLPLLDDLAAWADDVLTPEGVLAVLIGQTHLPEVYRRLDGHRPYRWTMAYLTPGAHYMARRPRMSVGWKPVLLYGGGPMLHDTLTSPNVKSDHHWGQDHDSFVTLVERLTKPGDLVADPFAGAGTTLHAAASVMRHAVGAEIDPDTHARAAVRMMPAERGDW
jgi:hypothetical protein